MSDGEAKPVRPRPGASSHTSVPDTVLAHAMDALERWDEGEAPADLPLPERHGPIVTNLLATAFRQQAAVDWWIERLAPRPGLRQGLRHLLRLTLTQLAFMQGIPAAAATDTAVRYARRHGGEKQAGFVNAVLRRFLREGVETWLGQTGREAPPWVCLRLGRELYEQWRRLGDDRLAGLAGLMLSAGPVTVRERLPGPADPADPAPAGLRPLAAPDWLPQARLWQCDAAAGFLRSPAFASGRYVVQDAATLLAPALLDPRPAERIGDLCCAPGGKLQLLDELAGGHARLIGFDRSPKRLQRVAENLAAGGRAMPLVAGDATRPPLHGATFDALLLDVPCSNTGVLRRHPDVRWRFTRANLLRLARLQADILDAAAPLLAAGGRLVYSTCSLEAEENEDQVRAFLVRHPEFRIERQRRLWPAPEHDGAFAARLVAKDVRPITT